jgi:hypothetical protein
MTTNTTTDHMLYAVADLLGDLRERLVFLGGAVRGLLVTDPAVEGTRPTDDVDVIVEVAGLPGYYELASELRSRGWTEDTVDPDAPICRFKFGPHKLDVMATDPAVLGFSNDWYRHAIATATRTEIRFPAKPPLSIRLITAPSFVATKLCSFASRGKGQFEHLDLEDIMALIDGRPTLLAEIEAEQAELRTYVADQFSSLTACGLDDKLRWFLTGDATGDARLPYVSTVCRRLARNPVFFEIGDEIRSVTGGSPGATAQATEGPWTYRITSAEPDIHLKGHRPKGRLVAVTARLTSHGRTAGTTGDGRDVCIEDELGRRFPAMYGPTVVFRQVRGLEGPYDAIWPDHPFETAWVYDLPRDVRGLRLCLPFGRYELRLDLPKSQ